MSFDEKDNQQEALVTDLNRSVNAILDSLNSLTGSFGEMVGSLESVMAASGVRDELFTREIRQAQQNLVEFRQKVEKLSGDQQHFNDKFEKVLPNTNEILSKLEDLSKDIMRYIMELTDRGWDKYQAMGESISKNLGELKSIYQEITTRCAACSLESGKPNSVIMEQLRNIDTGVRSCDQSLHTIKLSLPLDLSDTLRRAYDDRDGTLKSINDKLSILLKAHYTDHYRNEDGTSMEFGAMVKKWLGDQAFAFLVKYLPYILLACFYSWYVTYFPLPNWLTKSQPPQTKVQQMQQSQPVNIEKKVP